MPSRRDMLRGSALGFANLAFAGLCAAEAGVQRRSPFDVRAPHFPARAKRVIFLAMRGAPSQHDLFDYKPRLKELEGQPSEVRGRKYVGLPWEFQQHGQSGQWISSLLPNLARHADDLCVIKSMKTDDQTHTAGFVQLHTGSARFVRPSLGSWVLYGLGTENQNLPGFITIRPTVQFGGAQNYGCAFLPASYQGTPIWDPQRENGGVQDIANRRLTRDLQRTQLDLVQEYNAIAAKRDPADTRLDGVIESYELAFRMQVALPEVVDLSKESAATKAAYGIGTTATDGFGRQCLLARRLLESGVRFVEVMDEDWDHHFNLKESLAARCAAIDQPIGALLDDLKRLGMLDETLVIWGGEFGRTPDNDRADGRNHNSEGFTIWMAGGGVRAGMSYGETDELGYRAVSNRVHIHDLHATILHLLGFNHTRLTYRHNGREFRLTDVFGDVKHAIIG
ncbi:MAG TPA: DUF1501 domain-containing protein [Prosthecobacter sp.]|nr:DUF1501 domain-containing protein [Prosthecobacter sp.]HRK13271.1 DUF1501 domain-containing protein [Prosthecobacter sp.]